MCKCPACQTENLAGAETCENCGYDLTVLTRPRARTVVEKSLHKEPIRSLRKRQAIVVPADRKVIDVVASLVAHREGCAVVVDEIGAVVGVFSERDLIRRVAGGPPDLLERPVSEFMTPDPVTIEADAPIVYAIHQMDLGGYRHLPLVEEGKPIGMVSVRDIVTFLDERFLAESVA